MANNNPDCAPVQSIDCSPAFIVSSDSYFWQACISDQFAFTMTMLYA